MLYFERPIAGIDHTQGTMCGYVPANSPEIDPQRRRPAIVIIPGGYEMTSDREAEPIALQYLAAGYAAFVVRYSVKPSRYPTALVQVAQALRLIHENAENWHVDESKIALLGFSAGGHLAANVATTAGDDDLRQFGYDPDALRPAALMLSYAVITSGEHAHRGSFDALLGELADDEAALAAVSIERHVDAKMPPVFLWHTMTDDTVPVENALLMIEACNAAGVPIEAHLYPTGGHGLALGTQETAWQGTAGIEPAVQSWFELSLNWLERTL